MSEEIFMAGVRPGSPISLTEIKMLICYILSNVKQAMNFEQLYDALIEDDLVNYFELVNAIDKLVESQHINSETKIDSSDIITVTELGIQAAHEFETTLPISLRERALKTAFLIINRKQRIEEIKIITTPVISGGYNLTLSIPDNNSQLVEFTLFVPNENQCKLITRRFLNAPRYIYKSVLALLIGESDVLDEAFPSKDEQLF